MARKQYPPIRNIVEIRGKEYADFPNELPYELRCEMYVDTTVNALSVSTTYQITDKGTAEEQGA